MPKRKRLQEPTTHYVQCALCYAHTQCIDDGEAYICESGVSCKHRQDAIGHCIAAGVEFDIYECPYCYTTNVIGDAKTIQDCRVCKTEYAIVWQSNRRIEYIYNRKINKAYNKVSVRFVDNCTCCGEQLPHQIMKEIQ